MATKLIEMTDEGDGLGYNPGVGFYLCPDHVKALGLDGAQPGEEYMATVKIEVKKVTKSEKATEIYVGVLAMGIDGKPMSEKKDTMNQAAKLQESYGGSDVNVEE